MKIAILTLILIPCLAFADGFSPVDSEPGGPDAAAWKKIDQRVGQEYWFNFPSGCQVSSAVCETPNSWVSCQNVYRADKPKKVRIKSILKQGNAPHDALYLVEMGGGAQGYIAVDGLSEPPEGRTISTETGINLYCAFRSNPDDIRSSILARETARQQQLKQFADAITVQRAEAVKLAKKPGAHIGMTVKQVIEQTNWGKPDSINRTVISGRIDEQWVYDDGGYLYFRNGRLYAIQN